MIVGCYTLDLYCTHGDAGEYRCTAWPGQFTGRTEAECLREARANRWSIRKEPERVRCPKHRKRAQEPHQ